MDYPVPAPGVRFAPFPATAGTPKWPHRGERSRLVFSVYEAPSAAAHQQLNERAAIPFSRIVEAVVVTVY